MRLIDADKLPFNDWHRSARQVGEDAIFVCTNAKWLMTVVEAQNSLIHQIADKVANATTIDAVPLNEVYRVIAGHSNYQGDNILAALTCIAEGKEVAPVRPMEAQQMENRWIRCDEELPKYTDEYNVTVGVASEFGYFEQVTTLQFERINGKEPRWVIPKNEIYNVIAWMPLPTIYKEQ